ncbi:amino acid ABC transporter ATP-binding protein [Candidatus Dependentiae bacterium]
MIKIENLTQKLGGKTILKDLNISIGKGEVVALLGKSGSGKSTLLSVIAGLLKPTSGYVAVDGNIGVVLQDFQLFPHMTVLENVTYAPVKVVGMSLDDAKTEALKILKDLEMSDFCSSYPHQLSGGQKQRVAIARALAMNSEILLMDEPTSALDPQTSAKISDLIKKLAEKGITIVMASHEMDFVQETTKLFFAIQ